MKGVVAFLLVLCYLAISASAWTCTEAPRLYNAQQVDAGQGKVVARDVHGFPYFLVGSAWNRLTTLRFRHVSVGPAGLWASGTNNRVYKYVAGNFLPSSGLSMMQVDAGGDDQVVGITTTSYAHCLRSSLALAYSGVGSLVWNSLSRRLKYYSCSPNNGCWGVDTSNRIYYAQRVNSATCGTSGWRLMPGSLKMVEVGTDGNVFGVNTRGQVFQRTGISSRFPFGRTWVVVPMCMTIRHVSYDLRKLWIVTTSGLVMQCRH